jgi:hypothetical protein
MTEVRSYHGRPVIKRPVWTWEIPVYFFVGGVAGASSGFAYLVELRGNDVLARRAWATAFVSLALSPALLISDLGRPGRFLYMLRMFKVTSPISVGSWILTASGVTTAVAAVHCWTGRLPRAAAVARPASALLGLPLSTYTGSVMANTAVPVWHEARRLMPFVAGSGAAMSAGAATAAVAPSEHAAPARRLAYAGAGCALASKMLMERWLGELGEPYKRGTAARLARLSRACIGSGAALLALRGRQSRAATIGAGALLCAGSLTARWSVFRAGFESATDPRYVIGPQRAAIERGERRGGSRRLAGVAVADARRGSPATTA